MLPLLRKRSVRQKVLWVIAGIIIISFGFGFGISRYADSVSITSPAGKLFGKNITIKEFQGQYQATLDQAKLMHGPNLQKILPMLDLDNETWTRIMLIKEAEHRRIKVSDGEVIAYIQTMPYFQRDGGFDEKLYENILKAVFQRTPRAFEESIRNQIKIMKMFRDETMGSNLTEEAVRKEYERRNQKLQVNYVLINPDRFSGNTSSSDEELKAYYDAHQEEFLTPDSVNVSYLTLEAPEKSSDADKAKLSAKAMEIYKKSVGADLAAIAKDNGLTLKETGFFNMDEPLKLNWPLELLQQVFEAKKGDLLLPAETSGGIVIAKVIDLKPALIPAFEDAKAAIKEKIVGDKTLTLAKAKAEEIHATITEKLAAKVAFNTIVTDLKETVKETPLFSMGDYLPEIGISEDFESAAFDLSQDKPLSDVVITSKGPAIIYWKNVEPIDEKKFEEVKKDFTATLAGEERVSSMNRIIKDIKEKARLESYLGKLRKK